MSEMYEEMNDIFAGEEAGGKAVETGRLDNKGISTVEIILIICVLVALVLIFRNQITALVQRVFQSITENAQQIY